MHFREVNKKLKQLKDNVYWCEESLNNTGSSNPFYNSLWRDYEQSIDALKVFRNTAISKLN